MLDDDWLLWIIGPQTDTSMGLIGRAFSIFILVFFR